MLVVFNDPNQKLQYLIELTSQLTFVLSIRVDKNLCTKNIGMELTMESKICEIAMPEKFRMKIFKNSKDKCSLNVYQV